MHGDYVDNPFVSLYDSPSPTEEKNRIIDQTLEIQALLLFLLLSCQASVEAGLLANY